MSIAQNGPEIDNLLAQMTLEDKIGQMIQGFATCTDNVIPTEETRKLVQECYVGSFMTWPGIKGPKNVAKYLNQMQEWAKNTRLGIPPLFAIDADSGFREIGGEPSVHGATIFPMLMGMGATRDLDLVREAASITAKEARAMGIHWDLAPVADVVTESRWRRALEAFGDNADLVSEMVAAQVQGYQMQISGENYQENGVMATAKHFPGHGGVYKGLDSHGYPSRATYPMEVLENIHLKPFKAAIDNGVESIMIGHIVVEAIDDKCLAPFSRKVVTELLRKKLGFNGIIISDALDMGPIAACYTPRETALMMVKAGIDILMIIDFETVEMIERALIGAVNGGHISENQIDNSVRRILEAKKRLGLFKNPYVSPDASEFVGSEIHWNNSLEAARKSITMLKNENNYIPFSKNVGRVLVTGYKSENLANEIRGLSPEVKVIHEDNFERAEKMARTVDAAVVTTFVKHWFETNDLPAEQVDLVRKIQEMGVPMVVVSLGKPYDIASIPDVPAYLCTYDAGPKGERAIAEVLFGGHDPTGKLPVSIPGTPRNLYEFGAGVNYNYRNLNVLPEGAELEKSFEVSAIVANPKDSKIVEDVKLCADGKPAVSKKITLAARESKEVSFTHKFREPGFHTLAINSLNPKIVAVGVPSKFEYSRLKVPLTAAPSEPITISAIVTNIGSFKKKEKVKLYVDGKVADWKEVLLNGGEAREVSFTYKAENNGVHRVTMGDLKEQKLSVMELFAWIDKDNDGVIGGNDPTFSSIQAAIDNANSGDVIRVKLGYYDTDIQLFPIRVNKPVTVKSAGLPEETILDAGIEEAIFRVDSDGVTIEGFTITNGNANGWEGGIRIENVENVRIINNRIISNKNYGIVILGGGKGNHLIVGNIIENNTSDGINISNSGNNIIENNRVSGNGNRSNRGHGICLQDARSTIIKKNIIENSNLHGVFLGPRSDAAILCNEIRNNKEAGIWVGRNSKMTEFHHNNIVGNRRHEVFKEGNP